MLVVYKDETWLKAMIKKQKDDPETYEQINKKNSKVAFRLCIFETFCDLCWNVIHRDIEYR